MPKVQLGEKHKRASDYVLTSHKKKRRRKTSSLTKPEKQEAGIAKLIIDVLEAGGEDAEELARAFEEARDAEESGGGDWDSEDEDEGERVEVEEKTEGKKEGGRKSHREELETLKKQDPEFYKFLEENDQGLLEFDEEDDEDDGGEDGDDEDEEMEEDRDDEEQDEVEGMEGEDDDETRISKAVAIELVDMETVKSLKSKLGLKRTSLKAAKDLVRYFRAGRLLAASKTDSVPTKEARNKSGGQPDSEQEESELEDDETITGGNVKFSSAKVYQRIMSLAVTKILPCIDRALSKPPKGKQALNWDPSQSPRWKNLRQLMKAYTFHLTSLISTTTDAPTLRFLLRQAADLVPYANIDPLICRSVRKVVLEIWSNPSMSAQTRVAAYLVLRALGEGALRGKHPNLAKLLKSMCRVYRESVAATVNTKSLEMLEFCTECLTEMFGIDLSVSYTQAFNMLRDIAVMLRAVLTSRDRIKESDRVHNWSTINILRVLGLVLQRYAGEDEGLKPLVYPYVQVCTGITRLSTAPRVYGLRICLCRFMIDVMEGTTTFIPVHVPLLEHFRCAELRKRPARVQAAKRKGKGKGKGKKHRQPENEERSSAPCMKEITMAPSSIDFRCVLRVGEDVSRSADYLSGVVKETLSALGRFFAVLSRSIAYPEIAHRTIADLRQVAKEVRHPEVRRSITVLTTVMKDNENIVVEKRSRWKGTPQGIIADNVGSFGNVLGWGDKKTPMERYWEMEKKRIEKDIRLRHQQEIDMNDRRASSSRKKSGAEDENDEESSGDDESNDDDDTQVEKERAYKAKKRRNKKNIEFTIGHDEDDEIGELELTDEEGDTSK